LKSLLLLIGLVFVLNATTYKVDTKASALKFHATKMMFIGVDGAFSNFIGTIEVEDSKITSIVGEVEVQSMSTGSDMRDENLLSEGFFNLEQYPIIDFTATNVVDDVITGTLSIKGISKELAFDVKKAEVTDKSVEIIMSVEVDRHEFSLNGNMSMVISDDVELEVHIIAHP